MFKTVCGGKGGGSAYDPQISQAAAQSASTAADALNWSKQYYADVVAPMLQQQSAASTAAQTQMGELYGLQADMARTGQETYQKYGAPAVQQYYETVAKYSEPAEAERQAQLAKGDLETAQAVQQQEMVRQAGALGLNPASPAFASAMTDASVRNAAAKASAMNRARNAAQQMGLALKSGAADFATGKTATAALAAAQGAQGAGMGAFGVANQALQTGIGAGAGVQGGFGQALSGYGDIMGNYTRMGTADIQAQAASSPWSGLGQMAGQIGAAAVASDRRLKVNVQKVGELPSGLTVYDYDYVWGGPRQRGVMAQEVMHVIPDAVICDQAGYLAVDYSKVM